MDFKLPDLISIVVFVGFGLIDSVLKFLADVLNQVDAGLVVAAEGEFVDGGF